jgi:hypothetical protein
MERHGAYSSGRSGGRQRNRWLAASLAVTSALPAWSQAVAQSDAKPEIRVSATVLMTGFRNSTAVNNADVPTVVAPTGNDSLHYGSSLGASIRQTRLRLLATWSGVAGGVLDGEVDVDFFGGQQPSGGGRTHPVLRLRRAFAELRWREGSLLFGQEAPPVFEPNPASLASLGFPVFASSGNLWLWLPQVRGTAILNPDAAARIGAQAAVLAPSAGEPQDPFFTRPDRAERAGLPAFEGRLLLRWGSGDRAGELGVGGHAGWLAISPEARVSSRALGISLRAPMGAHFELAGEYFTGRGLAGLGGGGIGQNLTPDSAAVRTQGGWAQLVVRPSHRWELAAGSGLDDPRDEDLAPSGRRANRSVTAHVIWNAHPIRIGAQYQLLATRYASGTRTNHQVGAAFALEL